MYKATCAEPLALPDLLERAGLPFLATSDAAQLIIHHAAPLATADGSAISFFENTKYLQQLKQTQAGAVFVAPAAAASVPAHTVALVVPTPYAAFAQTVATLYPSPPVVPGIHPTAVIADTAQIDASACIEAGAVVQAGAVVGARVHIGPHTLVGEDVSIAEDGRIGAHCSLLNVTIGQRVFLHPGVRIGQDGFGFARVEQLIHKVPQIGRVEIGSDVEIGANTCIDRGTLTATTIGDGTKIDALVKIAHNVQIGRCVRIVGQTGIAGSTTIGDFALIGGQAGTAGHIRIAADVQVAARSGVTKSIAEPNTTVAGFPALPYKQWQKLQARLLRLARESKG